MSASRERTLRELLPKFEILGLERPIDLAKVLNRESVIVDFGSGMGLHALSLASSSPNVGVLAIDVHTVGLLAIAETATEQELTNLRTHHGDGMDVFADWLKPESITEVHVLFPDPWPKARHHKRRLISELFLDQVFALLKPGGRMVFVTDDESYFASAAAAISGHKYQVVEGDWDVPMTTYHQRAVRLGHKVSQLSAYKN
jgi:tRNA (guanine-N7-)-methyltransferase